MPAAKSPILLHSAVSHVVHLECMGDTSGAVSVTLHDTIYSLPMEMEGGAL